MFQTSSDRMTKILRPLETNPEGLFENLPDKTSAENFRFFHADEGKPLATPWQVAVARALALQRYALPEGHLLDCACGSGIQIIAYSEILSKPIIAVELNEQRARASSVNFANVFTQRGSNQNDRIAQSRVLVGDGCDAETIISQVNTELSGNVKISFLHLDPARPRNSRNHDISEMKPSLDQVFSGWHEYLQLLEGQPAILLDLSPRLSNKQMLQVEKLVENFWPNVGKTWTWTSRGKGRIDRLALWIGAISEPDVNRRYVRILPEPTSQPIEISGTLEISEESQPYKQSNKMPQRQEYISLIDAALCESGLAEIWLSQRLEDFSWAQIDGRRPAIYHKNPLQRGVAEEFLIQSTGKIIDIINQPLTLDTVDDFVETCIANDFAKVTIRASIEPQLQPKLQGSLDRQLSLRGGTRTGFIAKTPNYESFLLCLTN